MRDSQKHLHEAFGHSPAEGPGRSFGTLFTQGLFYTWSRASRPANYYVVRASTTKIFEEANQIFSMAVQQSPSKTSKDSHLQGFRDGKRSPLKTSAQINHSASQDVFKMLVLLSSIFGYTQPGLIFSSNLTAVLPISLHQK